LEEFDRDDIKMIRELCEEWASFGQSEKSFQNYKKAALMVKFWITFEIN
jgi:hypothetical protein